MLDKVGNLGELHSLNFDYYLFVCVAAKTYKNVKKKKKQKGTAESKPGY